MLAPFVILGGNTVGKALLYSTLGSQRVPHARRRHQVGCIESLMHDGCSMDHFDGVTCAMVYSMMIMILDRLS